MGGGLDYAKLKLTSAPNLSWVGTGAELCNNTNNIWELARMMQVHESQQSAAVVSTIAMLVGSKLNNSIDAKYREAIGDVILWDTPIVKEKEDWPQRRKYLPKILYESEEDMKETKLIVHGY